MKQIKGKSVLENHILAIARTFNVDVCFYDIHGITDEADLSVRGQLRSHCASCCLAVKKSPVGREDCIREEHRMLEEVASRRAWQVRQCRMGVVQLIVPLQVDGQLLGGLLFGIRFPSGSRPSDARIKKYSCMYHLDLDQLSASVRQTPEISRRQLSAVAPAALLLRDYILAKWQNKALRHRLESTILAPKDHGHPSTRVMSLSKILLPPLIADEQVPPNIREALSFIHANYWKRITREQAAMRAQLSPSQFSRSFRHKTGYSFRTYLHTCLVRSAAYLLKHSEMNVEDIALRLGYSSCAAFNRSFKSMTGFSPRRFMMSNASYPW